MISNTPSLSLIPYVPLSTPFKVLDLFFNYCYIYCIYICAHICINASSQVHSVLLICVMDLGMTARNWITYWALPLHAEPWAIDGSQEREKRLLHSWIHLWVFIPLFFPLFGSVFQFGTTCSLSSHATRVILSSLRWLVTDAQTLRKGQRAFPNSSAPAFSLLASLSVHTQAFLSCKPLVSVSVLVSFPSSLGSPFPECGGEDWCRLFQSSLYVWCYFKPLICRNSWIYLYHSLSEDKPINITLLQWCGLLCLDHTGSHSQGGYKAVFLAMGLHCLLCACREC